jgi:hypothetical protein
MFCALAAWALGGGFEFKGFKIPQISTTSRVLSVVTGGGLLLIWLVILIISLDLSDVPTQDEEARAAPNATRALEIEPTREPPVVVSDDIRFEIDDAIHEATLREELAYQMGNPDYFLGYFKGQALNELDARLRELAAAGMVRETFHRSWEVGDVDLSADGNVANVEVLMTMNHQFYFWNSWTWECSAYLDAQGVRVPMRLERGRAGIDEADWVISDIDLRTLDQYVTPGCSPFVS